MTSLENHAANQRHPSGTDSVDFYIRHGHALHARAAREGIVLVWQVLRNLVTR